MRRLMVPIILAAAGLIAAPAAALAQDFDDDFEDDFSEDGGDDFGAEAEAEVDAGTDAGGDTAAPAGGGAARGIGVGAVVSLTGVGGPAVVYDAGKFHVEGIAQFATNGATTIGLAGRFNYHLFQSDTADFSVGGGVGFQNIDADDGVTGMDGADRTDILLEGGAQIRMFLVPEVALSASLGLAAAIGDSDAVFTAAQLVSTAGITYFIP